MFWRSFAKWSLRGRRTSHTTVRKWIFRWTSGCGMLDQHRCGSKSKITPIVVAYVEGKLEEDDEVTSVELQRLK